MKTNFETLINKEISEIRQLLGYWWILDTQRVICGVGGTYTFRRGGVGMLDITTDSKNMATNVNYRLF